MADRLKVTTGPKAKAAMSNPGQSIPVGNDFRTRCYSTSDSRTYDAKLAAFAAPARLRILDATRRAEMVGKVDSL